MNQPGIPYYKLKVPTNKGVELIEPGLLVRVEAISNYSKLVFTNGKSLVVAKVLAWFEEELQLNNFLRTHRTHLVNSNFIKQYRPGQNACVTLINGETISVSKRKRNTFKNKITDPSYHQRELYRTQ